MPDRWNRYAPLTGVVFVGLLIASFAIGGSTQCVHSTGAHVISFLVVMAWSLIVSVLLHLRPSSA